VNNTEEYCLAIDQGTFSTRAIVYDATGKARHSVQQGISLHRIDTRHVEQDAQEILASLNEVLEKVIFFGTICRLKNHILSASSESGKGVNRLAVF
jgi:glycerol kinase